MKCPKCGSENPDYAYYCGSCASELRGGSQAGAGEDDSRKAKPRIKIESILYHNLVRVGENVARKRGGLFGRHFGPFRRAGTFVFKSEYEKVSLSFDSEGHVSVNSGIPTKNAVLLEGPHDSFLMMFRDEHKIDEIPSSIEVRVEGLTLPNDDQVRQVVRSAAGKMLRGMFE